MRWDSTQGYGFTYKGGKVENIGKVQGKYNATNDAGGATSEKFARGYTQKTVYDGKGGDTQGTSISGSYNIIVTRPERFGWEIGTTRRGSNSQQSGNTGGALYNQMKFRTSESGETSNQVTERDIAVKNSTDSAHRTTSTSYNVFETFSDIATVSTSVVSSIERVTLTTSNVTLQDWSIDAEGKIITYMTEKSCSTLTTEISYSYDTDGNRVGLFKNYGYHNTTVKTQIKRNMDHPYGTYEAVKGHLLFAPYSALDIQESNINLLLYKKIKYTHQEAKLEIKAHREDVESSTHTYDKTTPIKNPEDVRWNGFRNYQHSDSRSDTYADGDPRPVRGLTLLATKAHDDNYEAYGITTTNDLTYEIEKASPITFTYPEFMQLGGQLFAYRFDADANLPVPKPHKLELIKKTYRYPNNGFDTTRTSSNKSGFSSTIRKKPDVYFSNNYPKHDTALEMKKIRLGVGQHLYGMADVAFGFRTMSIGAYATKTTAGTFDRSPNVRLTPTVMTKSVMPGSVYGLEGAIMTGRYTFDLGVPRVHRTQRAHNLNLYSVNDGDTILYATYTIRAGTSGRTLTEALSGLPVDYRLYSYMAGTSPRTRSPEYVGTVPLKATKLFWAGYFTSSINKITTSFFSSRIYAISSSDSTEQSTTTTLATEAPKSRFLDVGRDSIHYVEQKTSTYKLTNEAKTWYVQQEGTYPMETEELKQADKRLLNAVHSYKGYGDDSLREVGRWFTALGGLNDGKKEIKFLISPPLDSYTFESCKIHGSSDLRTNKNDNGSYVEPEWKPYFCNTTKQVQGSDVSLFRHANVTGVITKDSTEYRGGSWTFTGWFSPEFIEAVETRTHDQPIAGEADTFFYKHLTNRSEYRYVRNIFTDNPYYGN